MKNRIFYGIMLFITGFLMFYYGSGLASTLFYALLICPIISIIHVFIVLKTFDYFVLPSKDFIAKGEAVTLQLGAMNNTFLYYPHMEVEFINDYSAKALKPQHFSLVPYAQEAFTQSVTFDYRGRYKVGIDKIKITDVMGLCTLSKSVKRDKKLTVYPNLIQLSDFSLNTNFMGEPNKPVARAGEDMSAISEVREYQKGDTLKRIHWKLTARMDKLMSKTYDGISETSGVIFLDLTRPLEDKGRSIKIEDALIESAVALSNYCLCKYLPLELIYAQDGGAVSHREISLEGFGSIYKTLSELEFDSEISLADIVAQRLVRGMVSSNVIFITTRLSYSLYEAMCKISQMGGSSHLILVSHTTPVKENQEYDDIFKAMANMGVYVYNPVVYFSENRHGQPEECAAKDTSRQLLKDALERRVI